jgi:hypothetical protein
MQAPSAWRYGLCSAIDFVRPSWLVIRPDAGPRAVLTVSSRSSPRTAVRGLKSSSRPRSTNKQQRARQQSEARTSHNRGLTNMTAPEVSSRHPRRSQIPAGGTSTLFTEQARRPARESFASGGAQAPSAWRYARCSAIDFVRPSWLVIPAAAGWPNHGSESRATQPTISRAAHKKWRLLVRHLLGDRCVDCVTNQHTSSGASPYEAIGCHGVHCSVSAQVAHRPR